MSVELVLKLLGRVPPDFYDLQKEWNNRKDGSFAQFDGRTVAGLCFHMQFSLPRNENFPLADLFKTIEDELAANRFVIVSLATPGGWHMFVICDKLPSGEFQAVSRIPRDPRTLLVEQTRAMIQNMKGTDILTYEVVG